MYLFHIADICFFARNSMKVHSASCVPLFFTKSKRQMAAHA